MKRIVSLFILIFISNYSISQKIFNDPEELVRALYDEVTFGTAETPNWDLAKSMFLEEAIVVLRYSRDSMAVFNVQEWVDDFVSFIDNYNIAETGFQEKILGVESFIYGDIASINVLFESHIPGTTRRDKGIDIFQLIKENGRWLIVSIVNERPLVGGPVPDIYNKN